MIHTLGLCPQWQRMSQLRAVGLLLVATICLMDDVEGASEDHSTRSINHWGDPASGSPPRRGCCGKRSSPLAGIKNRRRHRRESELDRWGERPAYGHHGRSRAREVRLDGFLFKTGVELRDESAGKLHADNCIGLDAP
jgi:hypothetical protein